MRGWLGGERDGSFRLQLSWQGIVCVRVQPVRTQSPFEKYRGIGNPGIPSGRREGSTLASRAARAMTTAINTNVI